MSRFANKVISITGASSGMGLQTARLLAARGAKLSLADIQQGPLKSVAEGIKAEGGQVISTVVDVRDRVQVESWIEKTVKELGKLDGAANIAGVTGRQLAHDQVEKIEDDDWDFVIGVNLKGTLNCLRAQVVNMKDGGSIVNFASIAGIMGLPLCGSYVASKHGVVGLTRAIAREYGPRGIRCNAICPGAIDTPMTRNINKETSRDFDTKPIPLGRVAQPVEVGHLVEWLLSDESSYITGTTQVIDGGWTS